MTKFEFIEETNPLTGYVRYWTEKDGSYVDHTISDNQEKAYEKFIAVASGIPTKPNIQVKETIYSSTE
jgi:hypothetical protein